MSFARLESEITTRLAQARFDGRAVPTASEEIPLTTPLPDDVVERSCAPVVQGVKKIARWVEADNEKGPW